MDKKRIIFYLIAPYLLSSCAYLQSVSMQNEFVQNQKTNPEQHNLKHIIGRDTYFVYGRLLKDPLADSPHSLAVVALSNHYKENEIVDVNHLGKINSYYGLNLPEGKYNLAVLEDKNNDGRYSQAEMIALHKLSLNAQIYPEKVAGDVDIQLLTPISFVVQNLDIPVVPIGESESSIFFPKGSIRSLDDPIFSKQMSTLGMYQPAAFAENAAMMFYALEEDRYYKIPVVFVHGIGGTVKEFQSIINQMDRDRYKPWFFYYPSGMDLNKLGKMFYNIYLSGKVVEKGLFPIIIIAHSMGGLVVREALNNYRGDEQENVIAMFISIASPFGGVSSAQAGVDHAPLVLPAWRNLAPESEFIKNLFRRTLPSSMEHHLIYAYRDSGDAEDSDGVVALSSLLRVAALNQLTDQRGFKSGHAEILHNPVAIAHILELMAKVKNYFPEEHLRYLNMGGFDVKLNDSYSKLEKFLIRTSGIYLRALANGDISSLPFNEAFLAVVHGREKPKSYFDTAWLKFREDYPNLAASSVD